MILEIDPEVEKEFRENAIRVYGNSEDPLKKAMEVAIKRWIEK